jgi:RNA polymerase sigma-70 factor (ECF subfamily)
LYDRHYRNVLGYALLRTDRASAEDAASETFLIAWRRIEDVPDPALPWLLGTCRNLLLKQHGNVRRREDLVRRLGELFTEADATRWDAAEYLIERETAAAALASLSTADVEALTLVAWHGLDPKRAAAVMGCSTAAFTVRLHRARRRLAKAFAAPAPTRDHEPMLRRSHAI